MQLSNNTSRVSGYVCGAILILAGVFSKFGAVFIAMPSSLIGGMTTFLFASVCVAGIKLLSGVHWSRRNRFIATASLSLGFAAICQPSWFSNFFTYSGSNHSLRGFLDALTLIVEESYRASRVAVHPPASLQRLTLPPVPVPVPLPLPRSLARARTVIALFIAVPLQAVMPLGEDDVVPPRDGDHDSVESVNQTKSARYQHSIERVGDVDEEMALGPIDSK